MFSGLIGPFLVYKGEAPFWPPPALPRLPIFVTWINTFVLLSSAVTMFLGCARFIRTANVCCADGLGSR